LLSRSERARGRAIADSIWGSQLWCHRKVDSLRLLEGDRGRRRVSLDCTPPPERALAEGPIRRRGIRREPHHFVLPIAMIAKGAMRDFDASLADGTTVPVLGRDRNGQLAYLALAYALEQHIGHLTPSVTKALRAIVFSDAPKARRVARELVTNGSVAGRQAFDPHRLPAGVANLALDLASNFLMVLVLPWEFAGKRTVIKYSFHWRSVPSNARPRPRRRRRPRPVADGSPRPQSSHDSKPDRRRVGRRLLRRLGPFRERWLTGMGYGTAKFELATSDPMWASSYHLEVHTPPGLVSRRLALPSRYIGSGPAAIDREIGTVAHAYASYPETPPPNAAATLFLGVPIKGVRLLTLLVLFFSTVVFQLEEHLPGARAALLDAPDGAVAFLLAVPAVVVALMIRSDENYLATLLLRPLRIAVLACAAFLVAGAASLVGRLHEPYLSWLWACAAWTTAAMTVVMLIPLLWHRSDGGAK